VLVKHLWKLYAGATTVGRWETWSVGVKERLQLLQDMQSVVPDPRYGFPLVGGIWYKLQGPQWDPKTERQYLREQGYRDEIAILDQVMRSLPSDSPWRGGITYLSCTFIMEWALRYNDPELSQLAVERLNSWTAGLPESQLLQIANRVRVRCHQLDAMSLRATPFRGWIERLPPCKMKEWLGSAEEVQPSFQLSKQSWYAALTGGSQFHEETSVRAQMRAESARMDVNQWRQLARWVIRHPQLGLRHYAEMAQLRFDREENRTLLGRPLTRLQCELVEAYYMANDESGRDRKLEQQLAIHMRRVYQDWAQSTPYQGRHPVQVMARVQFISDFTTLCGAHLFTAQAPILELIWQQLPTDWSDLAAGYRTELEVLQDVLAERSVSESTFLAQFQVWASLFAFEGALRLKDPQLSQLAVERLTQWSQGLSPADLWRITNQMEVRCGALPDIATRATPFRSWYEGLPDHSNPTFAPKSKLQSWFPSK
jgi:hypothetical protein